jgi:hypothetical protein
MQLSTSEATAIFTSCDLDHRRMAWKIAKGPKKQATQKRSKEALK